VLLGRVSSEGGADALSPDPSRSAPGQIHARMLCSVQAVKSAMQALVHLEVLVETPAVVPASRRSVTRTQYHEGKVRGKWMRKFSN
jgi:hypothetical protein